MYRSDDNNILEGFCSVTMQSTYYNPKLNLVERANVKFLYMYILSILLCRVTTEIFITLKTQLSLRQ
jgi:hypothetical protein